ncbi:pseudouridine-5'-phosphate glycosidase [Marininema mesophilum]|uniref:Pseudouridine-5'-phosphate glycosidase n=1 Tax=Marininema mesophilum TaxID=1048340 RepID=A0A1H2Y157_9BACL|nr:pseudouridine-5'-phosphate glycosidase [Marininema mesophilum]SDW98715.1 pseudouridine-5'-phosphate glycosidase [Marininema mesophilum]
MFNDEIIVLSREVKEAKEQGRPLVALESTIISHGMPWPENVETALELEAEIRARRAVPATIAILDGKVRVGLEEEEIHRLAKSNDVMKVSRRDLPYVISSGKDGATTVAATMIIAEWAGISTFATGGIGGVHREGENTLDISADLEELARTNVAVVCAGAKSILDIGLTLEVLETRGVPVVGIATEEFPAFYSRKSGYAVNLSLTEPMEIARMLQVKWEMGLTGGVVLAQPVPEENALDEKEMDDIIQRALQEAKVKGISGKDVTPFLLGHVKDLTAGKSLSTNIALVKNNARLAADIAVALHQLSSEKKVLQ